MNGTVQLKFHVSRIVALQIIRLMIMDVCITDHVTGRIWTTVLTVLYSCTHYKKLALYSIGNLYTLATSCVLCMSALWYIMSHI